MLRSKLYGGRFVGSARKAPPPAPSRPPDTRPKEDGRYFPTTDHEDDADDWAPDLRLDDPEMSGAVHSEDAE